MNRKARLSQSSKEDCFVECRFTTNSVKLHVAASRSTAGPKTYSIPKIVDIPKTHGLLWILTKSEAPSAPDTLLEHKAFFTTSEYAQEPPRVFDLFLPPMEELESEWKQTFESAQAHLSKMCMSLLIARGLDSKLIQALLKDSLLWDEVDEVCNKQIAELQDFLDLFWRSTEPHDQFSNSGKPVFPKDMPEIRKLDIESFRERIRELHEFQRR